MEAMSWLLEQPYARVDDRFLGFLTSTLSVNAVRERTRSGTNLILVV